MRPASPEQRFRHLLQLARIDGSSLIVVAAAAILGASVGHEWSTAAIGFGVVGCGVLELHGRTRLLRQQRSGFALLCAAQLVCLGLILIYARMLAQLPRADHILALLPSFSRAQLDELFPEPGELDALLRALQRFIAAAVALTAVIYQGGMAFYYLHARKTIRAAWEAPPVLPPHA